MCSWCLDKASWMNSNHVIHSFRIIIHRFRCYFESETLQFKTSICNLRKESNCQIFWRWMSVTQFVQFIYLVAFLVLLPRLNKRENIHWFQSYKWCEDNHWNKTILNAVKIRVMLINTNFIRLFISFNCIKIHFYILLLSII